MSACPEQYEERLDELQTIVRDLCNDGLVCMMVGAHVEALDQITCCDDCKIKYLQSMCNKAAWVLLEKYRASRNQRAN